MHTIYNPLIAFSDGALQDTKQVNSSTAARMSAGSAENIFFAVIFGNLPLLFFIRCCFAFLAADAAYTVKNGFAAVNDEIFRNRYFFD